MVNPRSPARGGTQRDWPTATDISILSGAFMLTKHLRGPGDTMENDDKKIAARWRIVLRNGSVLSARGLRAGNAAPIVECSRSIPRTGSTISSTTHPSVFDGCKKENRF